MKIQRNIVRIIGNLALNEGAHQAIAQSGKSVTNLNKLETARLCVILTGCAKDVMKVRSKIYVVLVSIRDSIFTITKNVFTFIVIHPNL